MQQQLVALQGAFAAKAVTAMSAHVGRFRAVPGADVVFEALLAHKDATAIGALMVVVAQMMNERLAQKVGGVADCASVRFFARPLAGLGGISRFFRFGRCGLHMRMLFGQMLFQVLSRGATVQTHHADKLLRL